MVSRVVSGHLHTTATCGQWSPPHYSHPVVSGHLHTTAILWSVVTSTLQPPVVSGHLHTTAACGQWSPPHYSHPVVSGHLHTTAACVVTSTLQPPVVSGNLHTTAILWSVQWSPPHYSIMWSVVTSTLQPPVVSGNLHTTAILWSVVTSTLQHSVVSTGVTSTLQHPVVSGHLHTTASCGHLHITASCGQYSGHLLSTAILWSVQWSPPHYSSMWSVQWSPPHYSLLRSPPHYSILWSPPHYSIMWSVVTSTLQHPVVSTVVTSTLQPCCGQWSPPHYSILWSVSSPQCRWQMAPHVESGHLHTTASCGQCHPPSVAGRWLLTWSLVTSTLQHPVVSVIPPVSLADGSSRGVWSPPHYSILWSVSSPQCRWQMAPHVESGHLHTTASCGQCHPPSVAGRWLLTWSLVTSTLQHPVVSVIPPVSLADGSSREVWSPPHYSILWSVSSPQCRWQMAPHVESGHLHTTASCGQCHPPSVAGRWLLTWSLVTSTLQHPVVSVIPPVSLADGSSRGVWSPPHYSILWSVSSPQCRWQMAPHVESGHLHTTASCGQCHPPSVAGRWLLTWSLVTSTLQHPVVSVIPPVSLADGSSRGVCRAPYRDRTGPTGGQPVATEVGRAVNTGGQPVATEVGRAVNTGGQPVATEVGRAVNTGGQPVATEVGRAVNTGGQPVATEVGRAVNTGGQPVATEVGRAVNTGGQPVATEVGRAVNTGGQPVATEVGRAVNTAVDWDRRKGKGEGGGGVAESSTAIGGRGRDMNIHLLTALGKAPDINQQ
ncbi:hypothetical protein ACOMHN_002509 [Nucella lapillus]